MATRLVADCIVRLRTAEERYCNAVSTAIRDLDAYWRQAFASLPSSVGRSYATPTAFYPYAPDDAPPSVCSHGDPPGSAKDNAFHCPADDTISWDESFLLGLFHETGEFGPGFVLSHEWGHHIQALLGRFQAVNLGRGDVYQIQFELQADCYAGSYARYNFDNGGSVATNDITGSVEAIYDFRTPSKRAWTDPAAHGQPQQRQLAYRLGFVKGGLTTCYIWEDYKGEPLLNLSKFVLALTPGTASEQLESNG